MFWPAQLVFWSPLSSFRNKDVMLLVEREVIGVDWDPSTPFRVPEYQDNVANMAVKFLS